MSGMVLSEFNLQLKKVACSLILQLKKALPKAKIFQLSSVCKECQNGIRQEKTAKKQTLPIKFSSVD